MANLRDQYRKMGFQEVHNLSEFLNVPSILNKARKNELRQMGITPLENVVAPRASRKSLTPKEKQELEALLARSLNWNNTNENINILMGTRRRGSSSTSDPKNLSRGSSPSPNKSKKGGRKTRKHKRRHTRKH